MHALYLSTENISPSTCSLPARAQPDCERILDRTKNVPQQSGTKNVRFFIRSGTTNAICKRKQHHTVVRVHGENAICKRNQYHTVVVVRVHGEHCLYGTQPRRGRAKSCTRSVSTYPHSTVYTELKCFENYHERTYTCTSCLLHIKYDTRSTKRSHHKLGGICCTG